MTNSSFGAFLLRSTLGTVLVAHGLMKVLVFTIPGTVGYFESIGFPGYFAYLTILGELGLGSALLLGLYTRLSALLSLPILLGATSVHYANGWVFSNTGGGWEFPAVLVALAVIVAVQGTGSFALIRRLPIVDRFIPAVLKV